MVYTKNKIQHILLILFVLLFSLNNIYAQNEETKTIEDSVYANYLLINTMTKKIIPIRDVESYNLAYIEKVNDSLKAENIYLVTGNIRTLDSTKMEFDVRNESIEQNFKDGSIIATSNNYSTYYYSKYHLPRQIDLNSIVYLDYSKPGRQIVHSIGIGTMFASAFTALVLAPTLNVGFPKNAETGKIDFANPSFNSKSYLQMVKIGVIGFAASIPIVKLTKIKRYNIGDKNTPNKETWYFEKVENLQQQ